MRTANLPPERRAQLSAMIEEGMKRTRLGPTELAAEAQTMLRTAALHRDFSWVGGVEPMAREVELWLSLRITKRHIEGLLNCPARPLANPERVARLLAVCLVLGLDRAKVNRLAGGV